MNSSEVRERLVEMHAILGSEESWRTKEDLLKIDRDRFPSALGHFQNKRNRKTDRHARFQYSS